MEEHGEGIQHIPVSMGSYGCGERDGLAFGTAALLCAAASSTGLAEGYGGSGMWQWMWWQQDVVVVGCGGSEMW